MVEKIECKICNKKFEIGRLMIHVKRIHKMDPKDYFNKYILKENNIPICPVCKNECKFQGFKHGYSKTCGNKVCIGKLANLTGKESQIKECIKRNKRWKEEIDVNTGLTKQQTIILKGENKRCEKRKETSAKQSESMKKSGCEKLKHTLVEKYNVENSMHIDNIKNKVSFKVKQKMPETLKKMEQTMLKKYGVKNASLIQEVIEKKKQSNKEKHKKYIIEYLQQKELEIVSGLDDYINEKSHIVFRCKKCGNVYKKQWNLLQQYFNCNVCNPMNSISNQEKEIADFLDKYNIKYKHGCTDIIFNPNTKRSYNIDFFIPGQNIAIEFNDDKTEMHVDMHEIPIESSAEIKPFASQLTDIADRLENKIFSYPGKITGLDEESNSKSKNVLINVSIDGNNTIIKYPLSLFPFKPVMPNMHIMVDGIKKAGVKQLSFRKVKPLELDEEQQSLLKKIVSSIKPA